MIIIPGEPEPKSRNTLVTELFKQELEHELASNLRFHRMMKIAALRRSCGVESSGATVSVRIPSRYVKD